MRDKIIIVEGPQGVGKTTFTNYLRSIRIIHFNNKTFIPIDINNIAKTRFNRFTSNIFSASN